MSLDLSDLAPPTPLRLRQFRQRKTLEESDVADIVRQKREENHVRAENVKRFHKVVLQSIDEQNGRFRDRQAQRQRDLADGARAAALSRASDIRLDYGALRYSEASRAVFERNERISRWM